MTRARGLTRLLASESCPKAQKVPASKLACTAPVPLRFAVNAPDEAPPAIVVNDPMITPLDVAELGEQENAEPLSNIVLAPGFVQVNVTTLGVDPSVQLLVPDVSLPVWSSKKAILVKQVPCPQLSPGILQYVVALDAAAPLLMPHT